MYYAMIDMRISTKINVANPYPVSIASSLRVLLVVNKFTVNKNTYIYSIVQRFFLIGG
jgi:hypothetical protein